MKAFHCGSAVMVRIKVGRTIFVYAKNKALQRTALESSIVLAFLTLHLLGAFLGTVSGRLWLWSGLRTLVIALLTAGIILVLTG
jgi:VIT1/CCC1 family predicted Fe2+/Mn2+ transporter